MTRRSEIGIWATIIIVGAVAGLAIAGMPELGAGPEPIQVITNPVDDTTTTTTTALAELTTTTTTTTATTTTLPEPVLRPTTEVTVLVVNGSTVPGAAGRLTEVIADQGHPTLTPISTSRFDVSEVWFDDDFGPEAADLANRLGVFPENIRRIPDDPGFSVGAADVVVIVGPDLAGS